MESFLFRCIVVWDNTQRRNQRGTEGLVCVVCLEMKGKRIKANLYVCCSIQMSGWNMQMFFFFLS